jgi:hypothetical protein
MAWVEHRMLALSRCQQRERSRRWRSLTERDGRPGATPRTLDQPSLLISQPLLVWYGYAAAVEGACFKYSRISALTRSISAR